MITQVFILLLQYKPRLEKMSYHSSVISKIFLAILSSLALTACETKDDELVETTSKTFANEFFNLRYGNAATLCTQESRKWLEYSASNVSQDDLDLVNNYPDTATCEVMDISMTDVSEATVKLKVHNFLDNDSLENKSRICSTAVFSFNLHKENDNWKVVLDALPVAIRYDN